MVLKLSLKPRSLIPSHKPLGVTNFNLLVFNKGISSIKYERTSKHAQFIEDSLDVILVMKVMKG